MRGGDNLVGLWLGERLAVSKKMLIVDDSPFFFSASYVILSILPRFVSS